MASKALSFVDCPQSLSSVFAPQGLMFRCSANCCEDTQASMQQVHQCIERCHAPLAQAQALVTSELERFQVRNASQFPSPWWGIRIIRSAVGPWFC